MVFGKHNNSKTGRSETKEASHCAILDVFPMPRTWDVCLFIYRNGYEWLTRMANVGQYTIPIIWVCPSFKKGNRDIQWRS